MNSRVAVIGAGAAGLMAAFVAAKEGAKVTLFEKNSSVGKKIAVSGNGRCNISNSRIDGTCYYGNDTAFIETVIKSLPFEKLKSFFEQLGVPIYIDSSNKAFPISNEAKSVITAFENALKHLGVDVVYEANVSAIQKNRHFEVYVSKKQYTFDKVLIATGLEAASHLGASCDGLVFAKEFGHNIYDTYAALVQLKTVQDSVKRMQGVRMRADATLYVNNQKIISLTDDVLFTSYGLSGLAILDLSIHASQALKKAQRVTVGLNLIPSLSKKQFFEQLRSVQKNFARTTIIEAVSMIIPKKVSHALLIELDVDTKIPLDSLTDKDIKRIIAQLSNWRFEIASTHGFKYAEVAGGGVNTADIHVESLESKYVKGLYFAGEVLDVVGARGGYNFHFAWASGMRAGHALAL